MPDDNADVARLFALFRSIPITAEDLSDEDAKIPPVGSLWKNEDGLLSGFDRCRLVAVDEADRPIGCGFLWRAPWTEPGDLNSTVIVDETRRGRGVGRALCERLERWAAEQGASRINAKVRDTDVRSLAFAQASGFVRERHQFESVLDPQALDLEALVSRLRDVERLGIAIRPMSELAEPDKIERIYAVYKETIFDIPGYRGDYYDLAEWRKWTIELAGASPDGMFVATRGDEYVGVAQVLDKGADGLYHEYTGVRKAYRGQGIALALKIACIRRAVERRATCLRTNNDSLNAPMLHINRDVLGYLAVPGYCILAKRLERGGERVTHE